MKNKVLGVALGVAIMAAAAAGGWYLMRNYAASQQPEPPAQAATKQETTQVQPGKIQSTDETVGSGAEATAGKKVSVNYVGTLTNGTKFDSSYDRNQPFSFTLGSGQVIKGWDDGVVGMKVGGKRKLVIPADLAYGDSSPSAAIPPNSTLVFEIELLGVE